MEFFNKSYSVEDLKSAVDDLDNNKYNDWKTKEQGTTYNIKSPKNKLYGPKRVYECLYKNLTQNKEELPIFGSTKNLRTNLEKAGFSIEKTSVEIDFEKIIKIKDYLNKDYSKEAIKKEICSSARYEFRDLSKILANDSDLSQTTSPWQNPNGTKINPHLWTQFKIKNKETPFSISLFYTNVDAFIITLEYKTDDIKATPKQLEIFNSFDNEQILGFDNSRSESRKFFKVINRPYIASRTDEIIEEINDAISDLLPFYEAIINGDERVIKNRKGTTMSKPSKNQILYGPPGTGKTYNTVVEAMKILKPELFLKKPTIDNYKEWFRNNPPSGKKEITDDYVNGAFSELEKYEKELNKQDISIFNINSDKEKSDYYEKLTSTNTWTKYDQHQWIETLTNNYLTFYNDFIIPKYEDLKQEFDELKKQHRIEFVTFHQSYSYEEFVEGIKPDCDKENIKYNKENGIFKNLCLTANKNPNEKFVLIIDEINRGNISKIFGELITLIEEDKRIGEENELKVTLPYSQKPFGVPSNLYIIGTMNTADKSLALLDVALRRRFEFVPMYPKYHPEVKYAHPEYSDILKALNDEILTRKNSADYLIGHSYFMFDDSLENIFNHKVIPLLMEYFNGKTKDVYSILTSTRLKNVCTLVFEDYKYPDKKDEYYYLQVKEATVKSEPQKTTGENKTPEGEETAQQEQDNAG